MEYLSRVLAYTTENLPFKFHPLCDKMKLSHLMFADDLLLFCKGDIASIMVLLRSFATFSAASGLNMKSTKTDAYFNGISKAVKDDILQISGFREGHMPFKYLGVPITCGRMTKADCNLLVEKLICRIRSFGSKKLSYTGRLVLVNSVLTTLYNYWVNIFLIPKGVINRINSICRNYLWDGSVDYIMVPMVSWKKVCSPKEEGGLGIKDSQSWNIAAIGKLVWWIYYSLDRLWVKWVNQIYLKGADWQEYQPSGNMSWGWKSICRVKDRLASGYQNGQWVLDSKGYTICSGYELVRQRFQAVQWHQYVWNGWCVPRHQFIGWLIAREQLQLKVKLFELGIAADDECLICGSAPETHIHLFQECAYGRMIFSEINKLCSMSVPTSQHMQWAGDGHGSRLKKGVLLCIVMATYYHIWMQRNKARVEGCVLRPEVISNLIKREVTSRILARLHPVTDRRDLDWLKSVNLYL
ncbi:uncharacterized protein LOC141651428 [Silene latifolia]|uniref:uncharacterized protein LOC141651428 n=1 Tax=Silene latifolia TaxID=37657 RepID=UPI003D7778A8